MDMDIYLDDSERGFWVVSAVLTEKPRALKKVMRRTKKAKLPPRQRAVAEVKASRAMDKFKRYFYAHLARLTDPTICCIYLDKTKIPEHLRGQEGLIYLRMVITLLELADITRYQQIYLYLDEKPLKGMTQQAFLVALKAHFAASFQRPTRFEVLIRNSQEDEGIQVADFVAHAFFVKYQYGNTQWSDLLKPLVKWELDATQVL